MPFQNKSQPIWLPARATTRDGVEWSPRNDTWKIPTPSADLLFSFRGLSGFVTDELKNSFKLAITNYLELHSPNHAYNVYGRMLPFLRAVHADRPLSEPV
jgi:hypothetical protein